MRKRLEERNAARKRGYAFACPYCDATYPTIKEAKACAKRLDKLFRPGDIVKFAGRVWRIVDLRDGLHLESVPEYLRAFGYSHIRSYQNKHMWYARSTFCNNDVTLFKIDDVRAQVKLRENQLKAAQKFLAEMEQLRPVKGKR